MSGCGGSTQFDTVMRCLSMNVMGEKLNVWRGLGMIVPVCRQGYVAQSLSTV